MSAATLRVLYVDDDRLNAFLFERTCDAAGGLDVACAASGAEAERVLLEFRPALLVIDLHLPDTDGFALLPRLRQALGEPALPALLCTAEHPDEVRDRARHAGFQGCLDKPLDVAAVARLREFVAAP